MIKCSSCNREVTSDSVGFKCPGCGKVEIIRCETCRRAVVPYKCKGCGFIGP